MNVVVIACAAFVGIVNTELRNLFELTKFGNWRRLWDEGMYELYQICEIHE